MTAPVRTRPTAPRRDPRKAPTRPTTARTAAARTSAAQRAYERKTERTQRFLHLVPDGDTAVVARRIPFVALVITLLAAGLVTTLWLSTRSAAGSYEIGAAQAENQGLSEQAEALRRDVAAANSPSALAVSAAALGMVPSGDVAHLVVAADGTVTVVGTPKPAAGTPGPSLIVPGPSSSSAQQSTAPSSTAAVPAAAAPTPAAAAPPSAAATPPSAAATPAPVAAPSAPGAAPAATPTPVAAPSAAVPGIVPGADPSPTTGGA